MITKINHTTIYVLDQNSAYDFYVNKLGFKVHTDMEMGPGMRWLTICPPEQPDLEIILMPVVESELFSKEAAAFMRDLIGKGTFGSCIFECDNLLATYEEMKAKGVEFKKPPTREFYGFEALFIDDSGNWFSLGEKESGGSEQ